MGRNAEGYFKWDVPDGTKVQSFPEIVQFEMFKLELLLSSLFNFIHPPYFSCIGRKRVNFVILTIFIYYLERIENYIESLTSNSNNKRFEKSN